jgi:hypothetical protein
VESARESADGASVERDRIILRSAASVLFSDVFSQRKQSSNSRVYSHSIRRCGPNDRQTDAFAFLNHHFKRRASPTWRASR